MNQEQQRQNGPEPATAGMTLSALSARAAPLTPLEYVDGGGAVGLHPPWSTGQHAPFSLSTCLRSKWLILATIVIVAGAAIPPVWLFMTPKYQAGAVVRIRPVVPMLVFRTEDNAMVPMYNAFLNTQVAFIKSAAVLGEVLENEEVKKTSWYGHEPRRVFGEPPTRMERLLKDLTVRSRGASELIDVTMLTLSPQDSKLIADAVVDEYKRQSDRLSWESELKREEILETRLASLQKEIDNLIAVRFNISRGLGTVTPEEVRSSLSAHLGTLEADRKRLQRELAVLQWEHEAATAGQETEDGSNGDPALAQDRAAADQPYSDDPDWRLFHRELDASRYELELARQQYGESHPRIRQLLAAVARGERLLAERETQLQERWRMAALSPTLPGTNAPVSAHPAVLQMQIEKHRRQEELLGAEIDEQRTKVAEAGEIAKELAQYEELIRQKRELYEAVRSRRQVLDMESQAPARISIASYAFEPALPHQDRRMLLTVMAVGAAIMCGLAAGYLRVNTDSKIREAGDLERAVRVPFLGQLPPIPKAGDLIGACDPVVTENMRMIRTALLERVSETGDRVVLVTSSSSQNGKTTVSILLAKSLAMLGKRVLLVEADLRRPSLAGRFGLEASVGLAGVLSGAAADADAIRPTRIPRLSVLVAGELPAKFDPELLANGVFGACLARWKKSYDFVLLDSPPVPPVADARILAGQADGTIMVLRSSRCRRAEVVQSYADLSAAGGKLLGTVLVGVRADSQYDAYVSPKALQSEPEIPDA